MAAQILSESETFIRAQFEKAFDECKPVGPTAKAILETLLTMTAAHAPADEVRPFGSPDRYVMRLVLGVLIDRYTHPIVALAVTMEG